MRNVLTACVLVGTLGSLAMGQEAVPERPVGIYHVGADGVPSGTFVASVSPSDQKVSGVWKAFAGIGGPKVSFFFPGDQAAFRLADSQPTFMLYIDPAATTARFDPFSFKGDPSLVQLRKPSDLVLVRLKAQDDSRLLDVKAKVDYAIEKVRNNVYRMKPKSSLEPGEYGFAVIVGGQPGSGLYEFGIDAGK